MKKEEAIYKAKHLRKVHPSICIDAEDFWETVIAALEQEPCDDCIRRSDIGLTDFEMVMCNGDYKEALKMLLDKIEKAPSVTPAEKQESCDDAISLEAVKNTMFMVQRTAFISDNEFHRTMDLLMRLPSVTPAEKVGRSENPNKWMAPDVLNHWIGAEVLDKIRAEIGQMPSELTADGRRMIRRGSVFRIIDKYKAEVSEE